MHPRTNTSIPAQSPQTSDDSHGERRYPGMLEVTVTEASGLCYALENAVDVVSKAAAAHGTGILISRVGTDRYIVRAHPGVPYGFIRQSYP
ncbi:hypothetical protein ACFVYC_15715 [Pseudarthrobacter sp. NPDC058329]|uniref:hypothetical protein n=1 Tax=Pseudarthrobacter sp. NPDC058329 TaxID=3346448 RepID=UPI0036DCE238